MLKRMISPDGGATHVYSASEELQLREYGWKDELELFPALEGKVDKADTVATRSIDRSTDRRFRENRG